MAERVKWRGAILIATAGLLLTLLVGNALLSYEAAKWIVLSMAAVWYALLAFAIFKDRRA